MNESFPERARRIRCCLLVLLASFAAWGQTATRGGVAGRVLDQDGNPLPGAVLTARSPSMGMAPVQVVSGENGQYRFSTLLPASDYVITAELAGFATVELSPIDVDPGRTTNQDVSLLPASEATESVVVSARGDVIDTASVKTSTVFNSEFLEGLPILGRTYQDVLTLAPGVTDVDGDGNPNVNGARETGFQTRLDGANVTDPFSGTFGQGLNLESIAEIEIITSGASAEFGQAQGGFANVITKSGGNEFEGSFKFFYRSDLFDNDGANNNDVSDENLFAGLDGFRDVRPFLTVGGPIVKDRLWYFAAIEYLQLESPVNTLSKPVALTETGWNNFAKLTWQVRPEHRLSFQVNHDPRTFTGLGLDTRTAAASDYSLSRHGYIGTARWGWNASANLLLEMTASRMDVGYDLDPVTAPEPCLTDPLGRCSPLAADTYKVDLRQGITTGPYYQTSEDQRLRDSVRGDLSYFLDARGGSHSLKMGLEIGGESFDDTVTVRPVRFEDFIVCTPPPEGWDDPTSPNYGTAGPFHCDPGDPDIGELPEDPTELPVIIGSINIETATPDTISRTAEKTAYGAYLQDSYRPLPNLTFNLGLRYDREVATAYGWDLFDPQAEAAAFLELYARGAGRDPGTVDFVDAFLNPAIVYDLNGDGLDSQHCTPYDVDGDVLGDGTPDGIADDFLTLYDGDFDGVADPDNPLDTYLEVPDGLADGTSEHPWCDRTSDDVYDLLSVFSRHQADGRAAPFDNLYALDPTRGLPGVERQAETFDIVNDNVAPRFSVAWDPWSDNRTKIFASWGRYYDRLFLATLVPELGPDPITEAYLATDRVEGTNARLSHIGRFSIIQIDRDLQTPFTDELTIGFERELAPEWVLGLTYIRRKGRQQLQDQDFNHYTVDENRDGVPDDYRGKVRMRTVSPPGQSIDPVRCFEDPPLGPGICVLEDFPDGQADLIARNPFFNQVLRVGNFNESDYISYQLAVTRRLSRRWQMTSSYVWSRAEGNAEEFLSSLGNDPGTVDDEYGPLAYDQTHQVKFSAVMLLPRAQRVGCSVLWASGTPYSIIRERDSADFFHSFYFRTTYPTGQRNDQRNEAFWTVNVSYQKSFRFGRVDGGFGVEVVNLLSSDDATVDTEEPTQLLGLEATRRFGRRWQLSVAFHF
ncbi:MAG: TonB-dependent receptor [Acidobacteriota bacterium]|jgi:hypothetical protein